MYYITTPTTLCVPYQNMTHRTQINLLFTLKCYNIHVHVYFFNSAPEYYVVKHKIQFHCNHLLYIHQIYRSIWHRIWQVRRPPFSSVQVSPKYSNNASLSALRIPCILIINWIYTKIIMWNQGTNWVLLGWFGRGPRFRYTGNI